MRSDRDFEKYLEKNPPKYDGYFQLPIRDESELPNFNSLSLDEAGERKTFVEHRHLVVQPLPLPLTWDSSPKDAELISITLVDFGKGTCFTPHIAIFMAQTGYPAQAAGEQPTVEEFAPLGLRSPEEILHSYFGPKIDIWAIGCLVSRTFAVPLVDAYINFLRHLNFSPAAGCSTLRKGKRGL